MKQNKMKLTGKERSGMSECGVSLNKLLKEKPDKMPIQKYQLLNKSLEAVSTGIIKLLILQGEPGFGKTYNTLKYFKKQRVNYKYVNNYTTPLAFYKLLYENRNKDIVVFDDLQGINDLRIKSMIKAVCWESENNKRKIDYYSTSPLLEKNDLPDSFEVGNDRLKIVLIFNEVVAGFESIVDRGVLINLKFSFGEKLKIFELLQKDAKIDKEILEYAKKNCNEATGNLSIRTLSILSDLKRAKYDFKLFAKEILKTNEWISDLINLSSKEWSNKKGRHIATFYRQRKKYGLDKR